jgi:acetate kinase
MNNSLLIINGGSSSIKFAIYENDKPLKLIMGGEIEKIGSPHIKFSIKFSGKKKMVPIKATDQETAAHFLIDWLGKENQLATISVVGHRIVHGMQHTGPAELTAKLINELKKISAFDPEHMPSEIKLVEIFQKRKPEVKQIACFDTSFHRTMPDVAKLIPIPKIYRDKGIERYGFHGLSYSYLIEKLRQDAGDKVANGKVILAHLGSGSSIAAVRDGKSIDTSMAFTPTSGLMMGTRTGDIDPGLMLYFLKEEKMSADEISKLVNHESGLLAISETTADMQGLLEKRTTDNRAAQAIELYCYQAKKWIGSYAAALSGLDTLVFSGGIGENSPEIRADVCEGFEFLGIAIDERRNKNNEEIISGAKSKVTVRVIRTNEELMIAQLIQAFLKIAL